LNKKRLPIPFIINCFKFNCENSYRFYRLVVILNYLISKTLVILFSVEIMFTK
jgi:hypothetical protein